MTSWVNFWKSKHLSGRPAPRHGKGEDKHQVDVGKGEPHGRDASSELVKKDNARISDLKPDPVEHAFAVFDRVHGDPGKHDPEDDEQEGRELDVTVVIGRRDMELGKERSPAKEKSQPENEIVNGAGPEYGFDPRSRFHNQAFLTTGTVLTNLNSS